MSTDETNTDSIRVINEEYERVLSNPDNLIMSDVLQELIDLPMDDASDEGASVDTLVITLLDSDGLGVSVRGRLSELSRAPSNSYTVAVETEKIRREFLCALEHDVSVSEETTMIIDGTYTAELTSVCVNSWSIEQEGPHKLKLKINFGSENVIF